MSPHDDVYLDLVQHILDEGEVRTDRTGVGTRAIFGHQMRFDLSKGFPLLTTKRVWWKGVVAELLWMLKGQTNIRPLCKQGVEIWTDWPHKRYVEAAREEITLAEFSKRIIEEPGFHQKWGDLGPVYGAQWRNWRGVASNGRSFVVDQIGDLIKGLIKNPDGRRHIVSAWNPMDLPEQALPPCHAFFQFDVSADGKLSCQLYQRSADVFLGVPFNIASYALLTHLVAHNVGMQVGEFIWTGGNTHIYLNHLEQVDEQLRREPRAAPTLKLNPAKTDIFQITADDIQLIGYEPHPAIAGEVAV